MPELTPEDILGESQAPQTANAAPVDPATMSVAELKILAFDLGQEIQQRQNFYAHILGLIVEKTNMEGGKVSLARG